MPRLLSLTYTRPKRVASVESRGSVEDVRSEGSVRSGRSGCSAGIPDSLAFDNIMNGGTCPVCIDSSTSFHLCKSGLTHAFARIANDSSRLHELPRLYRALGREPAILAMVQGLCQALQLGQHCGHSTRPGVDTDHGG